MAVDKYFQVYLKRPYLDHLIDIHPRQKHQHPQFHVEKNLSLFTGEIRVKHVGILLSFNE